MFPLIKQKFMAKQKAERRLKIKCSNFQILGEQIMALRSLFLRQIGLLDPGTQCYRKLSPPCQMNKKI